MNFNTITEELDILKTILEYNDYHSNGYELTTKQKQAKKIEIQNKVKEINLILSKFNDNLDAILKNVNQDFNFELFIDSLISKSVFDEVNPRIIYEEEQRLELIREELIRKEKEEEQRLKLIREELIRKNEDEANTKHLNTIGRSIVKNMYYNGPENIDKLILLLKKGYNLSDSIYPVIRLIERGRTIGFIQFLIQNGLKLNRNDISALKKKNFFKSQNFLNAVYDAKQIDNSVINQILGENG
jgi:hypothetical protein